MNHPASKYDSYAVLEMMAFDEKGQRLAAGGAPVWVGNVGGAVVGPIHVAHALACFDQVDDNGLTRYRVSADQWRWWKPEEVVAFLGTPPAPLSFSTLSDLRPMVRLEKVLAKERPTGAVLTYDESGRRDQSIIVENGVLVRLAGVGAALEANARLLSGTLFRGMGVAELVHKCLIEGRPLRELAPEDTFQPYEKARAIHMRSAAHKAVEERPEGWFVIAM